MVIGLIGVHVDCIPCMYKCLLSCLVFSPNQHDQTVPILYQMVCLSHVITPVLTSLPAPFVMPSSVLTFIASSVLSSLAKLSLETICFVFQGSSGIVS